MLQHLYDLGWMGDAQIIAHLHHRDPELLDMLLRVAKNDSSLTNPAGWLRRMGNIALQPEIDPTLLKKSLLQKYPALLADTDFNLRRYTRWALRQFFPVKHPISSHAVWVQEGR